MRRYHQIYLIARVTPHGQPLSETRYRCIAALRVENCQDHWPLQSAARFMTLIKQKENARIIREEIQNIHGLYGRSRKRPRPPRIPCPFAYFLMHSAWTLDLSKPGEYRVGSDLPAIMGTIEGNSNQGITVVDVSNPESPAYCLVFIKTSEYTLDVPLMTPLSATQYLHAYHQELSDDDEEDEMYEAMEEQRILTTLQPFESVPLINIDTLAEAWPGEYTPDPSGSSLEPKELRTTSPHIMPSLVDLIFVPALNHALQTGETDCLDPVMWLPGNVSKIKEALRTRNSLSAVDFALLSKVISATQTKFINLSHFPLTGEQVIKLLSTQECVEILDLSHMQHITTVDLRELIPILPKLRRLILLHTIPDADLLSLLAKSPELFYRIDSFIHLAFLHPLDQPIFPFAFSHIIDNNVPTLSLPYFTPNQLAQGLTDYFSMPPTQFIHLGRLLPLTMYASAVREPGRSWAERIVPFIPGITYSKEFNEPRGWIFTWSLPKYGRGDMEYRYAFAKFDKEATEECQQRINGLRSLSSHEGQVTINSSMAKASLSDEEILLKKTAIRSEYIDRKFRIFDLESFFHELVKEGRPAPSSEALTKLLDIFATLRETNPCAIRLMTQAELRSFLAQ